jgi:glycine cleavage system H protein
MKLDKYDFPDDLYYDREHNWARIEGSTVVQGMTDFAQAIAGEIVYAEAPRVGRAVERGKPFMSMESGKWVGRVKAIVSGKIAAANADLEFESSQINKDPYGKGWLIQVDAGNLVAELPGLLRVSDPAYAEFIQAERTKYGK